MLTVLRAPSSIFRGGGTPSFIFLTETSCVKSRMNKTRRTRRGGGWFSSKKPVAPALPRQVATTPTPMPASTAPVVPKATPKGVFSMFKKTPAPVATIKSIAASVPPSQEVPTSERIEEIQKQIGSMIFKSQYGNNPYRTINYTKPAAHRLQIYKNELAEKISYFDSIKQVVLSVAAEINAARKYLKSFTYWQREVNPETVRIYQKYTRVLKEVDRNLDFVDGIMIDVQNRIRVAERNAKRNGSLKTASAPVSTSSPAPIPAPTPAPQSTEPSIQELRDIVRKYSHLFDVLDSTINTNVTSSKTTPLEKLIAIINRLESATQQKKNFIAYYNEVFPTVKQAALYEEKSSGFFSRFKMNPQQRGRLEEMKRLVNEFDAIGKNADEKFDQLVKMDVQSIDTLTKLVEQDPEAQGEAQGEVQGEVQGEAQGEVQGEAQGGRRRGKTAKRRRRA